MSASVTLHAHFDAAHRLPQLPGKCRNLHGHTWQTAVTLTAPDTTAAGIVVEFGAFKTGLRDWIDTRLDHGAILGSRDPLIPTLTGSKLKVYRVGGDEHSDGLVWPTVETVARVLYRAATHLLAGCDTAPDTRVTRVELRETATNSATVDTP